MDYESRLIIECADFSKIKFRDNVNEKRFKMRENSRKIIWDMTVVLFQFWNDQLRYVYNIPNAYFIKTQYPQCLLH
jgi:hypothetical protein